MTEQALAPRGSLRRAYVDGYRRAVADVEEGIADVRRGIFTLDEFGARMSSAANELNESWFLVPVEYDDDGDDDDDDD